MPNPKLNYDVLLNVLEVADDRKTQASLMRTCQVLRRAGGRLLLVNGVQLYFAGHFESFCHFMLADATRFCYLRDLYLDLDFFPETSDRSGALLATVLLQAQQLENLTMDHSAVLEHFPEVVGAIAELTKLKSLSMSDADYLDQDKLHNMLFLLKSELRILFCIFHDCDEINGPYSPVDALEGVAPHLEELYVTYAYFLSSRGPVYPRLKKLSAGEGSEMVDCSVLVRAFPNLVYLSMAEYMTSTFMTEEEQRLENIEAQETLRWQHLSYVEGTLISLYVLALQCPITTLKLCWIEDGDFLPAVLNETTPTNLWLSIDDATAVFKLRDALSDAVVRLHLRQLAITVAIPRDLGRVLNGNVHDLFVSSVSPSPVIRVSVADGVTACVQDLILEALAETTSYYISLTLHWAPPITCCYFYIDTPSGLQVVPPEPNPTTVELQQLDPIHCSRQMMGRIRSVKTIALEWDHGPHPRQFVAVVEGEDNARTLEVLGQKEAENVQKQTEKIWQPDL